jgi:magnesium transporter
VHRLFREVFAFHPLSIEDALNDANIPKVDEWEGYLYIVFHAIDFEPKTDDVELHELDAFLGRQYLVTYRTRPLALVDRVWSLVQRDCENRLKRRPDRLLYLLLDAGVNDHLAAIEHLDEAIDRIMDTAMEHPTPDTLQKIFHIKRSVARVNRVIAPQREVANRLSRDAYPQVGERDRVYFRDVYDGLVRIHDLTESIRDLVAGAIDTYLSVSANRTNDIMKTLTIVTVLFLPLNFVVGFFGMNFFGENIALGHGVLGHTLLFVASCALMAAGSLGIWLWGKRRRWF